MDVKETRITKSEARYGWSPNTEKRCIRCALSLFSGLQKFGSCTGVFRPLEREFVCDNFKLKDYGNGEESHTP